MNGQSSKRLKLLFNPKEGDATSKKAYRLAKKQYNSMNREDREKFIKNLETIHNSKQ